MSERGLSYYIGYFTGFGAIVAVAIFFPSLGFPGAIAISFVLCLIGRMLVG